MTAYPVSAWLVKADGDTIGRFDNFEDADGMAAVWNFAYPQEPWFIVEAELGPES